MPKEGSQFICLSVMLINTFYRTDKNCYPKVFLKECKYVFKEQNTPKFINDNIEISSNDSDEENFNRKNSDEEN